MHRDTTSDKICSPRMLEPHSLLPSSASSRYHHPEPDISSKTVLGNSDNRHSSNNSNSNSGSNRFLNYTLTHNRSEMLRFESTESAQVSSRVRELIRDDDHCIIINETNTKVPANVLEGSDRKEIERTHVIPNLPLEIEITDVPLVRPDTSGASCSTSEKTDTVSVPDVADSAKCHHIEPIVTVIEDTNNSTEESNLNSEYDFPRAIERPTHSEHDSNRTRNEVVCCMTCQRCLHSIFCFHHLNVCTYKGLSAEKQKVDNKDSNYSECFNSVCKGTSRNNPTHVCCSTPVPVRNLIPHYLNAADRSPNSFVADGKLMASSSGDCEDVSNEINKKMHFLDDSHSYSCQICFKTYSSSSALANHIRYHRGDRPYQCEICNKAFATNSHLVTHRRVHTGERPFQCQTCHRSFADRSAFIKHERTHGPNGIVVKRFRCEECGNAFVDSCGLKKHMRIHTGERPYKCSICEKSFSTSSTYVAHKRIHSGERPYKCEQCSKMFITKSHLLTHRRVHTGEKPFTCQICSRSFADGSSFRRHERLHSGENRHVCEVCGKGFPCNTSLSKHKQSHNSGPTTFMYMM
ncbi:Krueppel homolog 1 [Gryllus bimaculatus]|nr:Krueppel homolog 1 [Gryllus bimaculatus]